MNVVKKEEVSSNFKKDLEFLGDLHKAGIKQNNIGLAKKGIPEKNSSKSTTSVLTYGMIREDSALNSKPAFGKRSKR